MACSRCGRNRTSGMSSSPAMKIQQNSSLSNTNFLQLHYVGESNVPIPTTLQHVTYGLKPYGLLMWVAKVDYETYPNIWKTPDEFANIST